MKKGKKKEKLKRRKKQRQKIKGKGGNSAGVPPLPIPNRAVKPRRADGTGKPGEQVAAPFRERSGDRRRSASTSFFYAFLFDMNALIIIFVGVSEKS